MYCAYALLPLNTSNLCQQLASHNYHLHTGHHITILHRDLSEVSFYEG